MKCESNGGRYKPPGSAAVRGQDSTVSRTGVIHTTSTHKASTAPSGFRNRVTPWLGGLKRWGLRWAEQFAYDVAGLPMAIWFRLRGRPLVSAPAVYVHWFHGRVFWRLPGGPLRGLAAGIAWPVALAVAVIMFTRRNGAAIRDRTGVPVWRQVCQQVQLAAGASIAPFWYYMFELYYEGRRGRAELYLTAHETIASAYSVLQPPPGADDMDDKIWFAEHCHDKGVRAVPVFLHFSVGESRPLKGGSGALPDCDLFVKPRSGSGGHRMERWDFIGDGNYCNSGGEIMSRDSLSALLKQKSLKDDFLVQPRLANHPALDDISNDALATVRLLTCRNESGRAEATNAAFRMAIGGNSVVDNFHQGGLATAVDLATGEIGPASDMGTRPEVGWRETHPVSGARFAGRHLPFWQDAMALACRAHEAFPQRIIVGWDVAFLADGVCIIEGNGKPDLDIHQRAERRPLGDQRIAALIALNIDKGIGNR